MRVVKSSNEFFDILDKMGNGKYVTIGYVTGANLNVPTIKRKNPLTNRMKGYPDFSVFSGEGEGEIGALVKITSYNMRYLNRSTVGKKYGEYKDAANTIRGEYGLDPIANKESYKQGTEWSPNGPELYKGQNTDLQSHSYNPQNIHGVTPKSVVYAVDKEGHIMKELSPEQVKPYLKDKREIEGVAALKKMGVEEERIKEYIERIKGLKFRYINFESSSILWIAATINGEKIVYINDNLQRAVDGINIRPEDFRAIARERYKIDLASLRENKTMKKKLVRLTESELMGIINESVVNILKEGRGNLDHHDPEYTGIEGFYDGMDANDYEFEKSLRSMEECGGDTPCPEEYEDKQDKIDRYNNRVKSIEDDWEMRNRRLRKKYPGKSREWYEHMIDHFYENTNTNKNLTRITESDLHNIVKDSVARILNEIS